MTTKERISTSLVPASYDWLTTGLLAALVGAVVVVVVQTLAVAALPEVAAFEPLRSYPRTVAFVVIPALVASFLLSRLARRIPRPLPVFYALSAAVLLLSFIPDFALPLPGKTLLASSVAAGLHGVAAVVIVLILTMRFRQPARAR